LLISSPETANLGSADPGTTASGELGAVTVTDTRAALTATWTATVSATSFTTGGGTPAETIPASAVTYWSGPATATIGVGTFIPGQPNADDATSLTESATAFTLTEGTGNNSATWDPTLVVSVPSSGVAGTYTGTVTHSVA
jgi:hypothetical protein